jgi:hypothetical protein
VKFYCGECFDEIGNCLEGCSEAEREKADTRKKVVDVCHGIEHSVFHDEPRQQPRRSKDSSF